MKKRFTLDFSADNPRDETHPLYEFFKALEAEPVKEITIAANKDGVFLSDHSFVRFDDPDYSKKVFHQSINWIATQK